MTDIVKEQDAVKRAELLRDLLKRLRSYNNGDEPLTNVILDDSITSFNELLELVQKLGGNKNEPTIN